MSSNYRILCLSHDPAIILDAEFHSGAGGRVRAKDALLAGVTDHPGCDLVIGRFSYPLVEVGTPFRGEIEWLDSAWLRLLALAQLTQDGSVMRDAARRAEHRWPQARLRRLRFELGIEDQLGEAP